MRALSIRQPYAELILRGLKKIEYRSRPTTIIGQRFHIYAARQWANALVLEAPPVAKPKGLVASRRLVKNATLHRENGSRRGRAAADALSKVDENVTAEPAPEWMLELANLLRLFGPSDNLPTGLLVGTAVISHCVPIDRPNAPQAKQMYEWHLTDVTRAKTPRRPGGHPQPVWWTPLSVR